MRNAYYQLLNRPSEICILRLAEIYNSNGQQRLLLARRNAITVGKLRGVEDRKTIHSLTENTICK